MRNAQLLPCSPSLSFRNIFVVIPQRSGGICCRWGSRSHRRITPRSRRISPSCLSAVLALRLQPPRCVSRTWQPSNKHQKLSNEPEHRATGPLHKSPGRRPRCRVINGQRAEIPTHTCSIHPDVVNRPPPKQSPPAQAQPPPSASTAHTLHRYPAHAAAG